jgi:hypothetical protein
MLVPAAVFASVGKATAREKFSTQDYHYLASLMEVLSYRPGINFALKRSDPNKILDAKAHCADLDRGATVQDLRRLSLKSAVEAGFNKIEENHFLNYIDSTMVVGIREYCPQHASQL